MRGVATGAAIHGFVTAPITKVSSLFVAEAKPCRQEDDPLRFRMVRRSLMFRLVRGLIATLAAAYALIVVALWDWQASFIFQPSPVVQTTPSDLGVKFEKVTLPIGSGQVAGWWVPSQDP